MSSVSEASDVSDMNESNEVSEDSEDDWGVVDSEILPYQDELLAAEDHCLLYWSCSTAFSLFCPLCIVLVVGISLELKKQ